MSDPSAAEDRAWTLESWGALPEDQPGELVDGRLQEEEVPTRIHEAALMWLLFALRAWGRPRGAKVYGSELKLAITDRRGRKPDGSVFLKGTPRSDARAPVQLLPPDVAIEIVSASPRDARRDRIEKPDDYAHAGVRFYWIVDPELRSFEVWERGADGRHTRALSATGGRVEPPGLDELVLDLDDLWSELDEELDPASE